MKIVLIALTALAGTLISRADLHVYEPFSYPPDLGDPVAGALDGKNAGIGFAGAWEDMTTGSNNGQGFIFGESGNTNGTNGDEPDWDGTVGNLPQLGGYVSLSPYEDTQFRDRFNCRRLLAQSAGDMAGTDGVLWMSMAVHFPFRGFQIIPGLMFTDGGGFSERSRDITDGSTGIGVGHGSSWGLDLNAITYNAGSFDTRTNVSDFGPLADNVIVLKYQFGDIADTVSTWYFAENEVMSEAAFDTNALSTTSTGDIDETTLTTLAVGFVRAPNAFDEIRIGDTFADVTSGTPAPGPVNADLSTVTASLPYVNADGASTSTITVTLTDAIGNPIQGKTVSLANTAGPQAATITPVSPVTGVDGEATFDVSSVTLGIEEFTATDTTDALVITQTASVAFVGATDAGFSTVAASPAAVQADGASTSTITVTLLDANGFPVEGNTVSLANTAGPQAAGISPVSPVSDVNGEATFAVSSSTPGTEEFTATDETDSVVVAQTASVTFIGLVDAGESTVEASADAVVADGVAISTITVTLKDAGGLPVAGKDVTLANTAGPMEATIDTTLAKLSDANGQVTFTVSSSTIGTEIFTATDETDALTITQTASVEFVDSTVPRPFNVSFVQFTPSLGNFEDPASLVGPAGGSGETWNQVQAASGSGLLSSTGVATGFGVATGYSECRQRNPGGLAVLFDGLTDFTKGLTRSVTFSGLVPGGIYDVWLASGVNSASASERGNGTFSTDNTTTTLGGQTIDQSLAANIATWEEGNNYVLFENVQVDGSGEINVSAAATPDFRLTLNGFQLVPVPPARILSFEAASAVGVIDQTLMTIDLEVPFGTDLATLAPTFALSSGSCDQTSGAPPSPTFAESNPVDYVVTDTSTDPDTVNTYAVTVTEGNPTATIVIDLGSGTVIPGGAFGTYGAAPGFPTNLPLPSLPAGSILRSIDIDTSLVATDNENFASDFALLFDPTPGTPEDTTFTLVITSGDVVFGTTTETLAWTGGGSGPPTPLVDSKTEADWAAVAPIDLGSTGLLLGNSFDNDTGETLQGGTWTGTITLTYDLVGGGSAYETWAVDNGLDGSPGKEAGQGDDPDTGGKTNLFEFGFNGDPLDASSEGLLFSFIGDADGDSDDDLVFTIAVRSGTVFTGGTPATSAAVDGIVYTVRGDADLVAFGDTSVSVAGTAVVPAGAPDLTGTGYKYVSLFLDGSVGETLTKGFMQAEVAETP